MADLLEREIDANFDSFVRQLHRFLPEKAGKYALMRAREIEAFFDHPGEAVREGFNLHPDGIFSVQEVTEQPVDLGFYNYAIGQGADR